MFWRKVNTNSQKHTATQIVAAAADLSVGMTLSAKDVMLLDWYSLSHIVHGLLFYAVLWLVARRLPVGARFLIAMIAEASWEVVENTPMAAAPSRMKSRKSLSLVTLPNASAAVTARGWG